MPEVVDRIIQRGSIIITTTINLVSTYLLFARDPVTSSRTFAARNTAVRHNHSTKFCLESTKWQIYFKIGAKKLKISAFKCWKWQHKWYNYMIRSYSFQNSRAFPMACATFETTAEKTLGTLACRDIWWSSFRWNASVILRSGAQLNFQFSLLQLHTKSLCVLALQNSQFEASTSSRLTNC